jgi:hypothetical protein
MIRKCFFLHEREKYDIMARNTQFTNTMKCEDMEKWITETVDSEMKRYLHISLPDESGPLHPENHRSPRQPTPVSSSACCCLIDRKSGQVIPLVISKIRAGSSAHLSKNNQNGKFLVLPKVHCFRADGSCPNGVISHKKPHLSSLRSTFNHSMIDRQNHRFNKNLSSTYPFNHPAGLQCEPPMHSREIHDRPYS